MTLSLVAIEPGDFRAVHGLCSRPEVAFWLGGHPADPPELWQKRLADPDPRRALRVGARLQNRLVGMIVLDLATSRRTQHCARLWMAVDPEHQRRGIGQRLVDAALEAADRWLALDRVELNTFSDNEPAIRLYARSGFVVEAEQKLDMLRGGLFVTSLLMARIRPGFLPPLSPPLSVPPRQRTRGPVELHLRPASPDDGAALAQLFQFESTLSGTLQSPFTPGAFWRQRITNNQPEFQNLILAEAEDRVVGAVGLYGSANPRRAHVRGLFLSVAEDFQGLGVGDRLMSAALDLADNWLGSRRVELTVNIDNQRAVRLYEHHGFVVEGRKRYEAFRDGGFIDGLAMARYHVNSIP